MDDVEDENRGAAEYTEYWRPAEHEYEPPVHNPYVHKPMPTEAVRTVHEYPMDTKSHPSVRDHPTHTVKREEPSNYFYEHPEAPVEDYDFKEGDYVEGHRTTEETDRLAHALQDELARRHIGGHGDHKQPIHVKATIQDVEDSTLRTQTVSQVVETVYDDLSKDRVLYSTTTDHLVNANVTQMPDVDGILKTFVDRYTTMLVHDSIYMEQMPTPQFMHQDFSMLHPGLKEGNMKHDPRGEWSSSEEEDNEVEFAGADDSVLHHPKLHELLKEAEVYHEVSHGPSAGQIRGQPQD